MANERWVADAREVLLDVERIYDDHYFRSYDQTVHDIFNAFRRIVRRHARFGFVEVADMKEFAEDVVYQFGYYCQNSGRLHITHGGLSTLEWAFNILGWENPHPVPECECEIEGCHEHATCGTPTADGYKRMCGKHYHNHCAES